MRPPRALSAPPRRPPLRRSAPRCEAVQAKGAAIGCGSSRAMVAAKTWPEPGVALKPPVPQPQFTNRPGTGVRLMMGERSGVTSTMPPQLRSIRRRRKIGNNSQIASSVWLSDLHPAGLGIARVLVGAGAEHQLALVRLADVGVHGVGHHHAGQAPASPAPRPAPARGSSRAAGGSPPSPSPRWYCRRPTTPTLLGADGALAGFEAVTRRWPRGEPVTSQFWMMSTPSASAARA